MSLPPWLPSSALEYQMSNDEGRGQSQFLRQWKRQWLCRTAHSHSFHCHLAYPVIMDESCDDDAEMKKLVRLEYIIAFPWEESFRGSCRIKHRPQQIECRHQQKPMKRVLMEQRSNTIRDHKMNRRKYSTQRQTNKYGSSQMPISRLAEFIP